MEVMNNLNKQDKNIVLSEKEYIENKITKMYSGLASLSFGMLCNSEFIVEVRDKFLNIIKEVICINLSSKKLDDNQVRCIFKNLEDSYKLDNVGIDYKIISKNGYVGGDTYIREKQYEQFGLKLFDFSYFEKEIPTVDLIAHNQYTYNQIINFLNLGINDICSVQPTGTGKSFLIARYVSDFINSRVLILSPSVYILEQFKKTFEWMNNNPNIRMMTYTKLTLLTDEEWKELISFNPKSICVDEYHRLGANSWGSAYNKLISTLRCNISSCDLKTFGVTATPRRFLDNNRDMSYELFDGNVANEITLYDAIARSILPMPKYVTVFHDISFDIKRLKEKIENSKRTSSERLSLKRKLKEIVKKWTSSLSVVPIIQRHVTTERKFIVFCESQEHMNEMMDKCKEWFEVAFNNKIPVRTYKMLSSYKDSAKEYEKFESASNDTFNLLFSVNSINEGVHPDVDAVIFCRNTKSGIIYYQQQGRCFKVGSGKTPLVLDLVNNAYNVDSSSFKDRLKDSINAENKRRAGSGLLSVDKYIDYEHSVIDKSQEVLKMFLDLEDRLIVSWDESYLKAVQYFENNAHIYVEKNEDEHLCAWLSKMRTLYKNGRLSEEKIEKLKLLNFDFELKDYLFNKHFIKLEKFFLDNGHSRVPKAYHDITLYNWVTVTRAKYANNELEQYQIDKLNSLNFVWNVNDLEWMIGFEELKEFFDTNGHSNATQSNSTDRLYNFRNRNKKLYKEGKLSNERIALLKSVNFDFSTQEDSFKERVNSYRAYIDKYNTAEVIKENDADLYLWLREVRKNYRKGKLSDYRISTLESLGIIWDIYEHRWLLNYKSMKNYYSTYGTLEIKVRSEHGYLYKWIQGQKREYESGKINNKRKILLDEFGFMEKIAC